MKIFLKSAISVIILGAILFGGYYLYTHWNNCDLPVNFTVSSIDPRFKITKEEVIIQAQNAANRWNTQTDKNLLVFNPNAQLKINLIYNSRQADLDKINAEIGNLTNTKESVDNWNQQYKNALASYQSDLTVYNNEVSFWNSKGGAPPDIYREIQAQKVDLDARRKSLNDLAQILNFKIDSYNTDLSNLNGQIDARKNLIVTQGLYSSSDQSIDVFTFGNQDELRLVLMHELGHALGLGHENVNQSSIMYPILGDQDLKNPTLTSEDIQMLQETCNLDNSFDLRRILQLFKLKTQIQ